MEVTPKVRLLHYTDEPERTVALAAKLCYSPATIDNLGERIGRSEVRQFLRKLLDMGHLSPFEHASFTFGIEGISRVTSHQLVRHRIASYSQQSQRYVEKKTQFEYIMPRSIKNKKGLKSRYEKLMRELQGAYREFVDAGVPPEDARYVLPGAAETKLVVTMNARELRHFFLQRCCTRAQWEIRKMAELMLAEAKRAAPALFADCGPPCGNGVCPEGEMSCGRVAARKSVSDSEPAPQG
ncbi:MAG: FAD-dependent thymidylate synthase [Candidatus Abyssubacteria bacterium]